MASIDPSVLERAAKAKAARKAPKAKGATQPLVGEAGLKTLGVDPAKVRADLAKEAEARAAKTKKAPKAAAAPKEPKAPKAPKVPDFATGAEPAPEEFFGQNRKGKPVFRIGFDARLTQILKRVQAGIGSAYDQRIATSPVILNHPKVADSKHFQVLLGNEEEEGEE